MAAIRLKKRNRTVIHQAKPLVFERVDEHWTLVEETKKSKNSGISFDDDGLYYSESR